MKSREILGICISHRLFCLISNFAHDKPLDKVCDFAPVTDQQVK